MIAADLPEALWRKSRRSGSDANCVEVAELPGALAMRDSKDPDGPVLVVARESWAAFVGGVRAGDFDLTPRPV